MFGVVGEQCFVRFHGALEDCDLSSTLPPTIVKESGSVVCEQLYQTLNAVFHPISRPTVTFTRFKREPPLHLYVYSRQYATKYLLHEPGSAVVQF